MIHRTTKTQAKEPPIPNSIAPSPQFISLSLSLLAGLISFQAPRIYISEHWDERTRVDKSCDWIPIRLNMTDWSGVHLVRFCCLQDMQLWSEGTDTKNPITCNWCEPKTNCRESDSTCEKSRAGDCKYMIKNSAICGSIDIHLRGE